MPQNTFTKEERLCHKRDISSLFAKGIYFYVQGIKTIWHPNEKNHPYPVRLVISVPKRNFKHAVDRNTIKRLIRESWRCNKNAFYEFLLDKNVCLDLGFVFTGKSIPSFKQVDDKILLILQQLMSDYEKNIR